MAHVFISYVRENLAAVDRLADALRRAGVEVWLDRETIKAGSDWPKAIEKAIHEGAHFLACFSQESVGKFNTYMDEELGLARTLLALNSARRSWFIPVYLNDCLPAAKLPTSDPLLSDLQSVWMYPDWQDGLRRIVEVVSPERSMGRRLNELPPRRAVGLESPRRSLWTSERPTRFWRIARKTPTGRQYLIATAEP